MSVLDAAAPPAVEASPPNDYLGGDWWDLNGTIHEYSYLTHNFFRYYGKFPSALARRVIGEFLPIQRGANIIDNYCGCGTTLVEAMLAGHNAVGVDINPLGILAAAVKTRPLPDGDLDKVHQAIVRNARAILQTIKPHDMPLGFSADELLKWFPGQVTNELYALRQSVYSLGNGPVKDFYLLAFAAIIRRVSTAFDGEVRPHFNKNKPQRFPLEAFTRKALDMRKRLGEFGAMVQPDNQAIGYLADNRVLSSYEAFQSETFDLALTHPPYLNCFDYIPVYRFELQWLPDLYAHWSLQSNNLIGARQLAYNEVRKHETHSWPAKPKLTEDYLAGNLQMLQELYPLLRTGGRCCVVIGDSTLNGVLLPVHQWFIDLGRQAGFRHERTIYRTTHYGTGKYAYEGRSHYHGSAEKRDAILVFVKGGAKVQFTKT